MKKTLFIVLLIFSSVSLAKEICPKIFPPENDTAAIDEFLKSLTLAEARTWSHYILHPGSLDTTNAYLHRFNYPHKKNLTVFEDSPQVSTATLIRISQWGDLFRHALSLPQETILYHQKWMSAEEAADLLTKQELYTNEYLPSTSDILSAIKMSTGHFEQYQVLFILEMDTSVRAIPGRQNLHEYVVDRGLKMTVLEAQDIPGMKILILRFAVEQLERH